MLHKSNFVVFRAMRNRGIEVYMFNEREGGVNEFDLKSLINLRGLQDQNLINALIDVHNFIDSHILGARINGSSN